jgi:hypothetical protein
MIIVQAFLLVVVGVASVGRARRNLGPEEWRQDLKFLASELPRKHKNLFFQLSKNEFERQVRELDESIPTLTEIEIRSAFVRLVASVGNAHTTIDAFDQTPVFPLSFYIFPDGISVIAAPSEHPELLGARLIAINGTPAEEVRRKLLPYVAKENDVAPLIEIPNLLRAAAPLKSAGVIAEMDHAVFTLQRDRAPFEMDVDSLANLDAASLARAAEPRLYGCIGAGPASLTGPNPCPMLKRSTFNTTAVAICRNNHSKISRLE